MGTHPTEEFSIVGLFNLVKIEPDNYIRRLLLA
jgi:hypothetical protein